MVVVERLIDAICDLDWPKDKMHIQILDDSTDHTSLLVEEKIAGYQKQGWNIKHIQRSKRSGFKAGALQESLPYTKGEFIAIFDADFVPPRSFLKESIPHLLDSRIGMVQACWTHLNRQENLLTKLSSILLDGHFVLEHTARNRSGRFFNFNGTAGIWRKQAILDAGGWEHDTVTEDLDLSYRAQLKNWKFIYLPKLHTPAEVPAMMLAFKVQQYRWAKGSIQTAKKLLPKILMARIPLLTKMEAFFHLSANISHPLTLCLLIFMPFTMFWRDATGIMSLWFELFVFTASSLSVGCFYLLAQKEALPTQWKNETLRIPLVLALGIGMSINQSRAFFSGFWSSDYTFIRTPKKGSKYKTHYEIPKTILPIFEIAMGIYCTGSALFLISKGAWQGLPFLSLFAWGFFYVGISSFWDSTTNTISHAD